MPLTLNYLWGICSVFQGDADNNDNNDNDENDDVWVMFSWRSEYLNSISM